MEPIVIPFTPNSLGRVEFDAYVMTGNRKALKKIEFKLDSDSDFTTISIDDLMFLGYNEEYLKACPHHVTVASTASDEHKLTLQYISDISIEFGNRELQGCRIYFAMGTKLRNLFGSDILKYFNREIDYDKGELRLIKLKGEPPLVEGEHAIHVYAIEN